MNKTEAAYHEAGHAMVGYYRGLPMESADIVETEGRVGIVQNAEPPKDWDIGAYGEEMMSWYFGHAMFAMAGSRAVEILNGCSPELDDPNMDYKVLGSDWSGLRFLAGVSESKSGDLQRAYDEAERVLRENWCAVEALALSLLECEILDRGALYSVLEKAGCSRDEEAVALVTKAYRSAEYDRLLELRHELLQNCQAASDEELPALEQEFLRVDREIVEAGGESWIPLVKGEDDAR